MIHLHARIDDPLLLKYGWIEGLPLDGTFNGQPYNFIEQEILAQL